MRLQKRKERGETYDPICLSDMESDDEWITEKEDACLPEDISWMDVHECFKEDEGVSGSKRKRGPRNLNKVPDANDKGKNQIHDLDDEEEEEEEEEEDDGGDDIGLHETVVIEEDGDDMFNLED
ncbi:hypothetical protein OSB04_020068 [Centaurea solstitialis]|uniref:Uncharacterized protein n=1 Tax=Centaurea solstitialis TaxID=347529 RepID=A0AA38T3P7_9ASTR|nr:hypothetical protein OSB04_020068 [Centaurea solstitialis]